jgi:hypothetical protein
MSTTSSTPARASNRRSNWHYDHATPPHWQTNRVDAPRLAELARWPPAWAHVHGRSQHGGTNSTRKALIERGLISYHRDRTMHLTSAGIALVGHGPGTKPPVTVLCQWCNEEPALDLGICAICDAEIPF